MPERACGISCLMRFPRPPTASLTCPCRCFRRSRRPATSSAACARPGWAGTCPRRWSQDPGPSILALVARQPELAELPSFWDLPYGPAHGRPPGAGASRAPVLPRHAGCATAVRAAPVRRAAAQRPPRVLREAGTRHACRRVGGDCRGRAGGGASLGRRTVRDVRAAPAPGRWRRRCDLRVRAHLVVHGRIGSCERHVGRTLGQPDPQPRGGVEGASSSTRQCVVPAQLGRVALRRRPLDYRWGISRQLVRDCRLGIEVSDARA